ncbi:MAG: T9SS type A sorting domain-containing protein, partial [Bacteroidetes bacterium]|nr:T9SS type A sorting domain-containing protein [Bacteroidota bacterium]
AQVTIGGTPEVLVSTTTTDADCGSDGTATATVSSGTAPFTYLWNTTPPQTTATATGLAAGIYSVLVTDGNGCTDTSLATVGAPPNALSGSIGAIIDENCLDGDGQATVNASGGMMPYSYSWATNPPQTTATATGLSAGTYMAYITDAASCEVSLMVTVGSTGMPPVFDLGPDFVACDSVLMDASQFGNGFSLEWSTGETTPQILVTQPGTYWLKVTEIATGCFNSDTIDIDFEESPQANFDFTVTFNPNPEIQFNNMSTPNTGVTYQWNYGDGNGSTLTSPTYSPAGGLDSLVVSLVAINSCGMDTFTQTVFLTSNEGFILFENLDIYPNPASNQLTILLSDTKETEIKVNLYNLLGQKLMTTGFQISQGVLKETLSLDNLPEGMYELEISGKLKRTSKRIVIQR